MASVSAYLDIVRHAEVAAFSCFEVFLNGLKYTFNIAYTELFK